MWFSRLYIYIYWTDYITLQKVRKIFEHVLSGHIRLLDEQKIPVLDTRSRFTGKVDKLDSSFGVWRQGHSEGALTAKNALLTPQVGSMVGQGQQSESLALSRRPTPGPHPQTIKLQSINTCSKRSRCLLVNRKNPTSPRTLISGTLLFSLDEVTVTSSCFKIRYSSFRFEPRWLNLKIAHMVKSQ